MVLPGGQVNAERHLMCASDHVNVLGNLPAMRRDVDRSCRSNPESARHCDVHEVWNIAECLHADLWCREKICASPVEKCLVDGEPK